MKKEKEAETTAERGGGRSEYSAQDVRWAPQEMGLFICYVTRAELEVVREVAFM